MSGKPDNQDIAYQQYKGPSRWVSAGALGAVEAKIAAIGGMFAGGALGAYFHKPITRWINQSESLAKAVETGSDMMGGKTFSKMFGGTEKFNASVLGALVVSTVAPILAFAHGTWKGYKDSDAGMKQFDNAQREIRTLRAELRDARSETKTCATRPNTEVSCDGSELSATISEQKRCGRNA